jgi:hypothetical protein
MIFSLCYEVQEEDGKQCERDDTWARTHGGLDIACVADGTAVFAFGSHETNLHIVAIAFWPGCSGPPGLQKETWRSEVELLILLMGACHVGGM